MSGNEYEKTPVQRSRLSLLLGLSSAAMGGACVDDTSRVTTEGELLRTHTHTMWNTGSFPSPYPREKGARYAISRDQAGRYSYRKIYPGGAGKTISEAEYDAAANARDAAKRKPIATPYPDPAVKGGEGGGGGGGGGGD